MKFNLQNAEDEYITTQTSYRELAEKYEVSTRYIAMCGKDNEWVKKRKDYQAEVHQNFIKTSAKNDVDKLANLKTATDNLIEGVMKSSEDCKDGCSSQEANQLATAINKLIAAQRDLWGLLSEKDKLNIRAEETETNETGVVVLPEIISDSDIAVSEGAI